jgi:RNA polymerase sigma factor (TIGR02999 family)
MSDVTRILRQIEQGDPLAAQALLPKVYDELRKLAAQKMAREKPGQTLEATALVHEAYLRLVGTEEPGWNGRGHFFAAAAEAMRRILIERARRRQAQRRGGGRKRLELDQAELAAPERSDDLLALDEALELLASKDARKAELVKLRYFAGLTMEQAAEVLGIAPATAHRDWNYARAWLHRSIAGSSGSRKQP